jgi:hypothetical protein
MPLKRKDAVPIDGAPKIKLGADEYSIPLLVPRQNRMAIPAFLSMRDFFVAMAGAITAAEAVGKPAEDIATPLTAEQYDAMLEMAYAGVSRAYEVTRDDILDMDGLTTIQLIQAFPVVARQSGAIKEPEPGK